LVQNTPAALAELLPVIGASRMAGIQYPVAVGFVRLGNQGHQAWPSPTVATAESTLGELSR